MITIHLFNGSRTKDAWNHESPEFVDDWKPETTEIKARAVQVTYRDHIKVYQGNGDLLELNWDGDGHIEHEGVYYGDMEIVHDHGRAEKNRRQAVC
jgi:cell wall-associated NlpC family hydrolase